MNIKKGFFLINCATVCSSIFRICTILVSREKFISSWGAKVTLTRSSRNSSYIFMNCIAYLGRSIFFAKKTNAISGRFSSKKHFFSILCVIYHYTLTVMNVAAEAKIYIFFVLHTLPILNFSILLLLLFDCCP